ncbi:MAG TPA: aldehyde dehydrogenase family protein, partial [Gemmatimonadales bacterium]
ARMEKLRVGSPLDKAVDMGAIVAPVQLERIRGLVEKGVEEGAKMWQPSWACPTEGYFYPPTLFTEVSPAATIAQVEIFGPVLVSMTFRTPKEAVELANNTPYGLAASVWTENINLALDVAPQLKAGVVWVNCTNLFDASSGFGGYRESGFGREGGREGMYEYLELRIADFGLRIDAPAAPVPQPVNPQSAIANPQSPSLPPIDRTYKLFIGGKQVRPDQGYARPIHGPDGRVLGEVGEGNRKDIRNAVEAAHAAAAWGRGSGHARAQVLYYIAENLATRADEFAARLGNGGRAEVDAAVARLFTYAAWADKWDGAVHHTPIRGVTLAMNEPVGVLGLVAPEDFPLLGFLSLVAPAIAVGNTVIAVPSEARPLAATEFYTVLETSDVPDGVINVVTGAKDALAQVLAEHDDVDGVWYCGGPAGAKAVEFASASNMKRTWALTRARDWLDPRQGEGREFLRRASEVKNIWIPYGE